jgi:hypothetical protein
MDRLRSVLHPKPFNQLERYEMFAQKKYLVVALYGQFGWCLVNEEAVSYKVASHIRNVILKIPGRDPAKYAVIDTTTWKMYVQLRKVAESW